MTTPIEQLCRQQRFSAEHPEWRIVVQNWGQHYLAERRDHNGWHVLAAPTLIGLLDRLDQIEAER